MKAEAAEISEAEEAEATEELGEEVSERRNFDVQWS